MTEPLWGDFACVSMGGAGGKLIGLAERLNGDAFSQYQHAFVYIGGGQVVEAEPGGARAAPLAGYGAILWSTGSVPLTSKQRQGICMFARQYIGTPYSWLDYAALAAHRLHLPVPGLRGFIDSTRSMICSQLVDKCYQDAGVHLFADNRWNGYVTPAALAGLIDDK